MQHQAVAANDVGQVHQAPGDCGEGRRIYVFLREVKDPVAPSQRVRAGCRLSPTDGPAVRDRLPQILVVGHALKTAAELPVGALHLERELFSVHGRLYPSISLLTLTLRKGLW